MMKIIEQRRQQSANIIKQQLHIIDLCTNTLQSLSDIFEQHNNCWLKKAYQVVQRAFIQKESLKQNQIKFRNLMSQTNLYPNPLQKQIKSLDILKQYCRQIKDYNFLISIQNQQNLHQKMASGWMAENSVIQNRPSDYIEKLVLKTNIENFLKFQQGQFKQISNAINRSLFILDKKVSPSQIKANRIYIGYRSRIQQLKAGTRPKKLFGDNVLELHTMFNICQLPNKLQSLSFLGWRFDREQQFTTISKFPSSLKKLRIYQNKDQKLQVPYNFENLINLKYLVIVDSSLSKQNLQYIFKFARQQQLRILCLVKQPRNSLSRNFNLWTQCQTFLNHYYPSLERHYLIYKRKLLQINYLARQRIIRKSYWAEEIINFASCEIEAIIQKEER